MASGLPIGRLHSCQLPCALMKDMRRNRFCRALRITELLAEQMPTQSSSRLTWTEEEADLDKAGTAPSLHKALTCPNGLHGHMCQARNVAGMQWSGFTN